LHQTRAIKISAGLLALAFATTLARAALAAPEMSVKRSEVTAAIVVSNFDPSGAGRVKVKFPLVPASRDNVGWARTVTPLTSGALSLPEVGDEVLVAFLDGDVNRPVVLGTLGTVP
jgi:uncharacterized protein involved in type VI secretion and phage assembly